MQACQVSDVVVVENLADISETQLFRHMSIMINKFNFQSVYSVSMVKKQFLPLNLNKHYENLNLLVFLLIWRDLRFINMFQVFYTGSKFSDEESQCERSSSDTSYKHSLPSYHQPKCGRCEIREE